MYEREGCVRGDKVVEESRVVYCTNQGGLISWMMGYDGVKGRV